MKSCFAYKNGCAIIRSGKCGGRCAFYKTAHQFHQDRKSAYEIIAKKPQDQQQYIADKYYGGFMPWASFESEVRL